MLAYYDHWGTFFPSLTGKQPGIFGSLLLPVVANGLRSEVCGARFGVCGSNPFIRGSDLE